MFRAAIFATVANLTEAISIREIQRTFGALSQAASQEQDEHSRCSDFSGETLGDCEGSGCIINDKGICESSGSRLEGVE